MRTLLKGILTSLAWIAPAIAATEANPEGSNLLLAVFLGFGAMIVVFQLIPSLILFGSMLKGIFSRSDKQVLASATKKTEE
jgi:hypothetical protein